VILVDSSIWIDHIRMKDAKLSTLVAAGRVLVHPFVIGEVALGAIRTRPQLLRMLRAQPEIHLARDSEVLRLIDTESLFGIGIGYVDAHLLASCRLTPGTRLWTRDKRLAAAADRLNLPAGPRLQ
jgi:predicted nucleic acid-binding protein